MKTKTHEHPCTFDYQTKKRMHRLIELLIFFFDRHRQIFNESPCQYAAYEYHVVPLFHSRVKRNRFFFWFGVYAVVVFVKTASVHTMVGMTLNYTEKHQNVLVFLFFRFSFFFYIWHRLSYVLVCKGSRSRKKETFRINIQAIRMTQ
jgi:hypothetical protein